MRITAPAHAALSRLAFTLTGKAERRVSLSEAIEAACQVATAHLDETTAALAGRGDDDDGEPVRTESTT